MIEIEETQHNESFRNILKIAILVAIAIFGAVGMNIFLMPSEPAQTTVPTVSADTNIITSGAVTMFPGDIVVSDGYSIYPCFVYCGIDHTYAMQVKLTAYFIRGGEALSTPIYPVIGRNFKVGSATFKLLDVDWNVQSITVVEVK